MAELGFLDVEYESYTSDLTLDTTMEATTDAEKQAQLQRQIGQRLRRFGDELQKKWERVNAARETERDEIRTLRLMFRTVSMALLKSVDTLYRYRNCVA